MTQTLEDTLQETDVIQKLHSQAAMAESRRVSARDAGDTKSTYQALSEAQRVYAAIAILEGRFSDATIYAGNAEVAAEKAAA